MDPRHESQKQAVLNHLIQSINTYLIDHTDQLVKNEFVLNEISGITKSIYHYLGMNIDSDEILSKHNLLSIDVVLFPTATDPEADKKFNDAEFANLMSMLSKKLQMKPESQLQQDFQNNLSNVINAF